MRPTLGSSASAGHRLFGCLGTTCGVGSPLTWVLMECRANPRGSGDGRDRIVRQLLHSCGSPLDGRADAVL